MLLSQLPLLNAILNSTSAVLLLYAHRAIRKGQRTIHKQSMISAVVVSSLFLISYVVYHSLHGTQHFAGQGVIRPLYFLILGSHTVLAASIVPLVVVTLKRGLFAQYDLHKRIARWTYPIWIYVSITGVIIYVMLYQIYPSP
jgi:putative membrane protein